MARGENKREIRAVDVWLSPGIEYGVVSVVVVEANAGRDRFTVLEKSATSRSRVVGAGFSTPRLVLKKPLKVKTGQQVGLNVRGFSGFVPFNFHDSREAPKFADGGIASSDAWSGSGDPGEVYAVAGNNLLNDPASELSGKFALMPVRFITGVAKDLQIAKEFLKKEYPAPEGKPKFRLTVTYTGSKPAKNIRVVDEFSKNRLGVRILEVTNINVKQRKKTTPVTCEVQRIDRLLVRCRAREMKSGGRFVVVVTTRIAASSPALSYADDVDGAIQRRSCECA